MNWIKIFEAAQSHEAQMLVSYLEAQGLHAVMLPKNSTPYALGYFEVLVHPDEESTAKESLQLYTQAIV